MKSKLTQKRVQQAVFALCFGTLVVYGSTATVFAEYDAATNTDTLTNKMISVPRGNEAHGDLKSYNHPDRNLVITWNDVNLPDGAPIRGADVNAKNITINADMTGNQWNDKAVISDGEDGKELTHISAMGDITITSHDDAIYTSGKGKVAIDGFKNLTIKTTGAGYGIVDAGAGVDIKGGEGSTITVHTNGERVAIGNPFFHFIGDHTTLEADTINISVDNNTAINFMMYKEMNPNKRAYEFSMEANTIKVDGVDTGMIFDGDVNANINQKKAGLVQLTGRIGVNGGTLNMNMDKDGSYMKVAEKDLNSDIALEVLSGNANINMKGNNSFITGDIHHASENHEAELAKNPNAKNQPGYRESSVLNLNVTGNDFKMKRAEKPEFGAGALIVVEDKDSTANLNFAGDRASFSVAKGFKGHGYDYTDAVVANKGAKLNLNISGKDSSLTGNIMTKMPDKASVNMPVEEYEKLRTQLKANFSGDNFTMKGDFETDLAGDTIDANFTGKNASLTGRASAKGQNSAVGTPGSGGTTNWKYSKGAHNTLNLTMSGDDAKFIGVKEWDSKGRLIALKAEGDNTLNAKFTGRNTSVIGDVINKGLMNLTFGPSTSMTGNITNTTFTYMDKTTYEGKLKATYDNSKLTGDVKTTAGTAELSFSNGATWTGNLATEGGKTKVTLNSNSEWTGSASDAGEGSPSNTDENGYVAIDGNARWNLTKNSVLDTLKLDAGVVNMEGAANRLTLGNLIDPAGGGIFRMDLVYQDDNIATYRDGNGPSDYIIVNRGNGSTFAVEMTPASNVDAMTDGSKLYFATTGANSLTFKVNDSVQIRNYKQIFDKDLVVKKETDTTGTSFDGKDNWFLTVGPNGTTINPNGKVPGTAYNAAFAVWRDGDTLLKRLGELRYNTEDQGIWARFVNRGLEKTDSHAFKGNYKTFQIGYDKEKKGQNSDWFYGVALDHLWGSTNYYTGHGKQRATNLTVYGTNVRPHGHYLDLVAKVGRMHSDYTTTYTDKGEFSNWGTTISAEYGRKKMLASNWAIEPQAQLTYGHFSGDTYTTSNGAKVQQDSINSLVGRLGIVLSREFDTNTEKPSRVYAKASVLHDFRGRTNHHVVDGMATFNDMDDLGGTWYALGLGADIQLKNNTQFYFDAERSFKGEVKEKYRFNLGVRYGF